MIPAAPVQPPVKLCAPQSTPPSAAPYPHLAPCRTVAPRGIDGKMARDRPPRRHESPPTSSNRSRVVQICRHRPPLSPMPTPCTVSDRAVTTLSSSAQTATSVVTVVPLAVSSGSCTTHLGTDATPEHRAVVHSCKLFYCSI